MNRMLSTLTPSSRARLAGTLYLIVVLTGIFSLLYVPSRLFTDDAILQFNRIREAESLFRWGIAAGIVCYLAFTFLPLVLYTVFHSTHREAAILMVVLALLSIPISFMNLGHYLQVLDLLHQDKGLSHEANAIAVQIQLQAYDHGIFLLQVFWGLWLFPFGYLVYRSGLVPRILGILLMLGCLGYLIQVFVPLLYPAYRQWSMRSLVSLPASLGEIGTCLWLLIAGVKTRPKN